MITTYINHRKTICLFDTHACFISTENLCLSSDRSCRRSSPILCKSPYFKLCLTKYTGIFALLCFKWKLNIEK
ncbi:hypothetical protein T10_4902 [Trichinella papuae]|uniref:Uncharacterized protein n=1 Tax=Trichinella papuae TaxID=268474 RepID=A0A0V1MNG9_9BILA|nr:hypothetical protein T10_4902 [Trichinella papuae]